MITGYIIATTVSSVSLLFLAATFSKLNEALDEQAEITGNIVDSINEQIIMTDKIDSILTQKLIKQNLVLNNEGLVKLTNILENEQ